MGWFTKKKEVEKQHFQTQIIAKTKCKELSWKVPTKEAPKHFKGYFDNTFQEIIPEKETYWIMVQYHENDVIREMEVTKKHYDATNVPEYKQKVKEK